MHGLHRLHAVAAGSVDAARVGLMGGSYGGFMSSWLVTQTPSSRRGPRLRPVQPVPDRQSR
nr:prolyl oligopeptidase family serine peptidase [Streptomyces sp. NBRC 110030]